MVSGKESGCGERYGEGIKDSGLRIPDSLLGKRGSVRVGSAPLFSLKRCGADSPLPFPDWVIRLRGIGKSM